MKLSFITLAAVLLLCPLAVRAQDATAPQAVPFHITSYNTPFAMQGDFEGEYRVYPRSIEVSLTKAVIRISEHCPYKGRREFSAFGIILASEGPNGKWDKRFKSQKYTVGRIMFPGDEYSLGAVHFSIPKEETTDLTKHFFVIYMDDLVLDHPKGKPMQGFSLAVSCKDIFTQRQRWEQSDLGEN
ncbi:MAG: hypothetical protein ICV68_10055 [Pyrinomonadaceae bacterium]|nr:hypothetical protein [Pyrinomonadaceae bacterium]